MHCTLSHPCQSSISISTNIIFAYIVDCSRCVWKRLCECICVCTSVYIYIFIHLVNGIYPSAFGHGTQTKNGIVATRFLYSYCFCFALAVANHFNGRPILEWTSFARAKRMTPRPYTTHIKRTMWKCSKLHAGVQNERYFSILDINCTQLKRIFQAPLNSK